MIQITKKLTTSPIINYSQGAKKGTCKLAGETTRLENLYLSNPEQFDGSGDASFKVYSKLYGHPDIKEQLIAAQDAKCCFCEAKVIHTCPGDVEHFRPKRGFSQSADRAIQKPGYYWLTYNWDNLLFCCIQCNRRDKANLFPLQDEASRATSPADDLTAEQPLFIHPVQDNPADYITFHQEVVAPVTTGNQRAITTIESLQLNENIPDGKMDRRRTLLNNLNLFYRFAKLTLGNGVVPDEDIIDARREIENSMLAKRQYAGMARANFAHRITWTSPTTPKPAYPGTSAPV
jgi:uncharacterized protein (TIGR02646 family)